MKEHPMIENLKVVEEMEAREVSPDALQEKI